MHNAGHVRTVLDDLARNVALFFFFSSFSFLLLFLHPWAGVHVMQKENIEEREKKKKKS